MDQGDCFVGGKQYLIHWCMRATRKDGFEGHDLVGEGFRFKRLVVRKCVKGLC